MTDNLDPVVNILRCATGIYSAHYNGVDASYQVNLDKLLNVLKYAPNEQHRVSFYCLLIYLRHVNDQSPLVYHGLWQSGVLTYKAVVGDNGLSYASIFYVLNTGKTAAEITRNKKTRCYTVLSRCVYY